MRPPATALSVRYRQLSRRAITAGVGDRRPRLLRHRLRLLTVNPNPTRTFTLDPDLDRASGVRGSDTRRAQRKEVSRCSWCGVVNCSGNGPNPGRAAVGNRRDELDNAMFAELALAGQHPGVPRAVGGVRRDDWNITHSYFGPAGGTAVVLTKSRRAVVRLLELHRAYRRRRRPAAPD